MKRSSQSQSVVREPRRARRVAAVDAAHEARRVALARDAPLLRDDVRRRRRPRERVRLDRREARRRRREQQASQQQSEGRPRAREDAWYNRNRVVRAAMDTLVYVGFAVLVYLVARGLRQYKRNFDQRIEEGRAPNEERTWGYESRTGADWKPDVHDDDLDSAHVGATTATDEEWHPTLRDEDLE